MLLLMGPYSGGLFWPSLLRPLVRKGGSLLNLVCYIFGVAMCVYLARWFYVYLCDRHFA